MPAAHPDGLTKIVIASLKAANPPVGSPEAEFLALLETPKPMDALRQKVSAYLADVRRQLGDPSKREAEISCLYQLVLDRRKAAVDRIPTLVEVRLAEHLLVLF